MLSLGAWRADGGRGLDTRSRRRLRACMYIRERAAKAAWACSARQARPVRRPAWLARLTVTTQSERLDLDCRRELLHARTIAGASSSLWSQWAAVEPLVEKPARCAQATGEHADTLHLHARHRPPRYLSSVCCPYPAHLAIYQNSILLPRNSPHV